MSRNRNARGFNAGDLAAADRLPRRGAAGPKLRTYVHDQWASFARIAGIDLTGFDPAAPYAARVAWALAAGLAVGAVYTRFSTKRQGSTRDQARTCVEHAARNRIYTPPELACVDEARKGRKVARPGLRRLRRILRGRLAGVVLVFKLSRLFRQMYKSVQFVNERVVERGLRAVAVTQQIDTANEKSWRLAVSIHGVMDEELLSAIADHVRAGLVGLFLKGWCTGALAVGYRPVEVPGGPPTRRGRPRTMPEVDPDVAEMIVEHFRLVDGGMPIRSAWLKWVRDGGPADPRSRTKRMSYQAYHRMLSRREYLGIWRFCRKRNHWVSSADTLEQREQPESEVQVHRCEELRIVDDELFFRVQEKLAKLKTGPRQRTVRAGRVRHLWDAVVHLFACPHCGGRFHVTGAGNRYMHCPHPQCPAPAMVHREDAVRRLCAELSAMVAADTELVDLTLASFKALPEPDAEQLDRDVESTRRQVQRADQRIRDLEEMLGSGGEDDRKRRKEQILHAQHERSAAEARLATLQRRRNGGRAADAAPVTREAVVAVLADLVTLLDDAAAGRLGPEVTDKAADVLEKLVGGRVWVHASRRPGRSRWTVKGAFTPCLLAFARGRVGGGGGGDVDDPPAGAAVRTPAPDGDGSGGNSVAATAQVSVWLREPPRVDQIADEVHHLYEVERIGFRLISQRLEKKYGEPIGSGNCCLAYKRYFEIRGLPVPPRRTAGGRPRKNPDQPRKQAG